MTRKRIKEILPIIQAYAEGKDIQYRLPGSTESWKTFVEDKCTSPFNHDHWEYRIKPEPLTFYLYVDEHGDLRGSSAEFKALCPPGLRLIKVVEVL